MTEASTGSPPAATSSSYTHHLTRTTPRPFVLLDVVHERNIYPVVELVPLQTAFIESEVALLVPTREGLLGEQVDRIRPEHLTGVPLNERRSTQSMKQLFDIGELFDATSDLAAVRAAHAEIFQAENGYRGGKFTAEQALQDAFDTACCIAQVGLAKAPKDGRCELLEAGRKQIECHLVGVRFRREEMKIAGRKAALLASVLRGGGTPEFASLRYDDHEIGQFEECDVRRSIRRSRQAERDVALV